MIKVKGLISERRYAAILTIEYVVLLWCCDPQRSNQKGGIEVAHELIRRVLPKGTSFNSLTQKDVLLITNHINSYTRKKIGNQTAYNTFCFLYGEEAAQALGMSPIPANEINLTPSLLKK